jgi:DNA-binding transcriptional regulator LsrR (DeoR family)
MTGRQVRRGVVFDLDGVIVDSEHLWEESWTAYAREQGREWRREDTLRLQGLSTAEWARSTQILAGLLDAEPIFLRIPGVVPTPEIRELLLSQDGYARQALEMLDEIDLALVGIGTCDVDPPLRAGESYFTEEELQEVRRRGAVGQVCLRFIDADGAPVDSPLDSLVLGVTTAQLRSARRRWAAAGGRKKYIALRAALRGGWVDSLVTDAATAQFLASTTDAKTDGHRPLQAT